MFLRVRRRRNAVTADMLPIQINFHKRECPDHDEELHHQRPAKRQRAILRKVATDEAALAGAQRAPEAQEQLLTKSIVDAVWERGDQLRLLSGLQEQQQQEQSPREETLSSSRKGIAILDPVTRLIDDSLAQAVTGEKSCAEHATLCRCHQQWYNHTTVDGDTLLHACALWNDAETAATVVSSSSSCSDRLALMTKAVDSTGRTPYAVAVALGHQSVCQVLEAFGGDDAAITTAEYDDDGDYVVDVYRVESQLGDGAIGDTDASVHDGTMGPTVTIAGAKGFWDGKDLMLAHEDEIGTSTSTDDDDSNCEAFEGNDYPEDEAYFYDKGVGSDNEDVLYDDFDHYNSVDEQDMLRGLG